MKTAELTSAASDQAMTYADLIKSPVYRVHVTTALLRAEMTGLDPANFYSRRSLRARPRHRGARINAIRKTLADKLRALRAANGRRNVIIKRIDPREV